MKGERQRWKYGEGRIDRRRRDEKERKTECEAAVYLPNKLDRISSIIKEEREMGKTRRHRRTRTHKKHLSVSGHTTRSHHHHRRHTHTYLHMCSFVFLRVSLFLFFLQLCVSIHVSGYVCLKTVSQRISRDLLVILLNTHPPPTPLLTPPLPNLASAPSQRSTSVASMSSHQYEQIIRALRGLSINPHCEYSSHPLPFLSSLPFLSVFLPPPPHLPLSCPFHPCF